MSNILNENKFPKRVAIFKAVLFWIVFIVLLMCTGIASNTLLPAKWKNFSYGILGTLAAFTATWIFLKIDKKSFADYGLILKGNTFFRFFKGFVIGAVCFGVLVLLLISFTTLTIERTNTVFSLAASFWYLSIIPMAFMEELGFRAYPFLKLYKIFGLRITQVIVALAFAVYHIVQGWDIEISFLGPGIWAFVFGLGAIWSKGIALPTGIHVALNFLQQVVGMHGNIEQSFWVLKQQENSTAQSIVHIETMGIVVQVLVLVVAVVLTEWYIKQQQEI
jgi:membrane protease YdiL (CAAX protease family)